MIDRFLRQFSISWRMLGVYTFIIIGFVLIAGGVLTVSNSLIEWVGELKDLNLQSQILEVVRNRYQLFLGGALVVFIGGLISILIVSRSVTRQLSETRESIERIRAGHFEGHQPVGRLDEIGLINLSVNHLASQLLKRQEDQDRKTEENLRLVKAQAGQLEVASELAREVSTIKDLTALTDRCANLIQERFGYYYVGIYLFDDERRFLVMRSAAGSNANFILQRGVKIRSGEINLIGNVAGSGEPRIINNVEMDYIYRKDPLLPATRAEAIIPLKSGTEVIGVVDIHSESINSFTEKEITILQILADELSIGVQNARLIQQLNQSSLEAQSLYQRYTQTVWSREATGKKVDGYEYDLLDVHPIGEGARTEYRLPVDELGRLKSGKAVRLESRWLNQDSTSGENPIRNRTVLLIPLLMYNQLIGLIGMEEEDRDHEWTDDEIAIIEAVTAQVALSLDNARLLEESQIRSGQLRLLQEVTAVAASHTSLSELLDNVSQKLRASFSLLHCGMFWMESDGRMMSLVANASADPFVPGAKLIGTKIFFDERSVIAQVIQTRSSFVIYEVQKKINDESNDSLQSMRDFLQIRGCETIIFVPLFSRGEVMGVASLELAEVSNQFSESDLQLMDQISLQISSAIDVARSFEQATLRADRERRVAEITSRIRESLDIQTILKTTALEVRQVLGVPEVTIRLAAPGGDHSGVTNMPGDAAR